MEILNVLKEIKAQIQEEKNKREKFQTEMLKEMKQINQRIGQLEQRIGRIEKFMIIQISHTKDMAKEFEKMENNYGSLGSK